MHLPFGWISPVDVATQSYILIETLATLLALGITFSTS